MFEWRILLLSHNDNDWVELKRLAFTKKKPVKVEFKWIIYSLFGLNRQWRCHRKKHLLATYKTRHKKLIYLPYTQRNEARHRHGWSREVIMGGKSVQEKITSLLFLWIVTGRAKYMNKVILVLIIKLFNTKVYGVGLLFNQVIKEKRVRSYYDQEGSFSETKKLLYIHKSILINFEELTRCCIL